MPSQKKQELLGILGGLGPMASVYFYELLTAHTAAEKPAGPEPATSTSTVSITGIFRAGSS